MSKITSFTKNNYSKYYSIKKQYLYSSFCIIILIFTL